MHICSSSLVPNFTSIGLPCPSITMAAITGYMLRLEKIIAVQNKYIIDKGEANVKPKYMADYRNNLELWDVANEARASVKIIQLTIPNRA